MKWELLSSKAELSNPGLGFSRGLEGSQQRGSSGLGVSTRCRGALVAGKAPTAQLLRVLASLEHS